MLAGWALRRSFHGLNHASAIPALPESFLGFLENGLALNRCDELVVSPLVPLLNRSNLLEGFCDVLETFLSGIVCKPGVESSPFVSLAGSRGFQLS